MFTHVDAKGSEGSNKYTCESCNYHTSRLSQFNKHLLTAKHKMFTNVDDRTQKSSKAYVCIRKTAILLLQPWRIA